MVQSLGTVFGFWINGAMKHLGLLKLSPLNNMPATAAAVVLRAGPGNLDRTISGISA
jgi:hypothetical protein